MPQPHTDRERKRIDAYFRELRKQNLITNKPVRIGWKVSEHRRGKQTGRVNFKPSSAYARKQYQDAMRKWRDNL